MLQLNSKGYLSPPKAIPTDLATMRKVFVEDIGSANRAELFENLLLFCREFCRAFGLPSLKIWVNGSFTSTKPEPGDLDLLVFVDHDWFEANEASVKKQFNRDAYAKTFRLDLYFLVVFPENHPKRAFSISDEAYWMQQFTQTRPNRRGIKEQKGFLELNIPHDAIRKS